MRSDGGMAEEQKNRTLVGSEELSEYFCLSTRRIFQLTADGTLAKTAPNARKYDLKENVQRYVQYLQRKANGRASVSEEELKKKKLEADIALKESQGELHRLKTSIANGEYISVEEVQMDYGKFFVTFKKFAMNLPSRIIGFVSGQLEPAESRKLEQDLSQEINGMLNSFVIAGTEAKPAAQKKTKRGRPKKNTD
jgi:hypothetical protein